LGAEALQIRSSVVVAKVVVVFVVRVLVVGVSFV
jgi:hypothetical protein